jgi:Ca2+-binding RTX toxin-like protein
MTTIPIYILAGQSNASYAGLDAALVSALSATGGAYELVKLAVPGTQLAPDSDTRGDWSPSSGELFDDLIAAVRAREAYIISQGFTPVIETIFWVQGEADGRSPDTANAYAANLEQFIDQLRTELSCPDARVVLSMLSTQSNPTYTDIIRAAQLQATELDNVVAVDPSDLALLDQLHYTLISRFELGERLVAQAQKLPHDTAGYVSQTSGRTVIAAPDAVDMTGTLDGDILIGNDLANSIKANFGANLVEGRGGADMITGGYHADTVFGGEGNDLIYGAWINTNKPYANEYLEHLGEYSPGTEWNIDADSLWGEGGNDTIYGGVGKDQLIGGTGDDTLYGEIGRDWLTGDDGDDRLDGGLDADTMRGGTGNDRYWVDNLGDLVIETEASGTDLIYSSVDISLADAGRVIGEVENITLLGTAASATGNGLSNTIRGNAVDNTLDGGLGNDSLFGEAGNDSLVGGGGDDRLDGGAGVDTLVGGAGNDLFYVDDAADVISEGTGGGANDMVYASVDYTLGAGQEIEDLRAAAGATGLRLTGNELANQILGGAGNDTLAGGGGVDRLHGGAGDDTFLVTPAEVGAGDTITGGIGIDTVEIGSAGRTDFTQVTEFTGVESLLGSLGDDTIVVSPATLIGITTIDLREGYDAIETKSATLDLRSVTLAGVEEITTSSGTGTNFVLNDFGQAVLVRGGSAGATITATGTTFTQAQLDQLFANGVTSVTDAAGTWTPTNEIIGTAGNDTLSGTLGADTFRGLAGDDLYYVNHVGDVVLEAVGEGYDRVTASVSYQLAAGSEIERLTTNSIGGTALIDLTGNEFGQTIVGNAANNRLDGKGGADELAGREGDDIYIVDNVGDTVIELANFGIDTVQSHVSFTLSANVENLTLLGSDTIGGTGNALANVIIGNGAANVINGGGGNDILRGRAGNDTLSGGAGNDTIVFDSAPKQSNVDHIVDFQAGDVIELQALIFPTLSPGALSSAAFKDLASGAVDADDRILYDQATGSLFYDANGSAAGERILFAVLDNQALITHQDFIIAG